MLNILSQLERELELKNPENRRILRAYEGAEIKRLDKAVYSHLEKEHPSLSEMFKEIRKGRDPVEYLEKFRVQNREFSHIEPSIKPTINLVNAHFKEDIAREVRAIIEKYNSFYESSNKLIPSIEQFYIDLARAVRVVSARRKVGIEEAVENLQYMDEASKIVIPTRIEAELLLMTQQSYSRIARDSGEEFIRFFKKIGYVDGEVLEKEKLIPTAEVMEALQKGVWGYKMQEFDRVYSEEE